MLKKRVLLLIVSFGLFTAIGFSTNTLAAAQDQTSDEVFKTPEDAITFYMQGIAEGNVSKILQACAIHEMSENFSLSLSTARIGAFDANQTLAPSDDPFYVEMNKEQLSARILSQVRMFVFSLLSTQDVTDRLIIIDAEKTTQFIKDVDPSRLAQIEVKTIAIPFPEIVQSAKYLENATKFAQVYGADEYSERVALFQFEGDEYLVGFTLLRYGENWKIASAYSPIANIASSGATGKITESDFEKLTQ